MRNWRAIFLLVAGVILAAASPGQAADRGDAARGEAIAKRWCAACHLVAPGQAQANADVPTFASIARRLPGDADVLAAFIANPHPPMPNLSLGRQDIQDLLAYIGTLK